MKNKVVRIDQIKEARRLQRAYEITGVGPERLTVADMADKIVEMDERSDQEYVEFLATKKSTDTIISKRDL